MHKIAAQNQLWSDTQKVVYFENKTILVVFIICLGFWSSKFKAPSPSHSGFAVVWQLPPQSLGDLLTCEPFINITAAKYSRNPVLFPLTFWVCSWPSSPKQLKDMWYVPNIRRTEDKQKQSEVPPGYTRISQTPLTILNKIHLVSGQSITYAS